jgi:mRNA interferase YafQ
MRRIEITNAFKRDYKREIKSAHKKFLENSFDGIIQSLAKDKNLPDRFRDHALTGKWDDFRDCYLKPDLILIYQKVDKDCLTLVRLGSHSELSLC